jgi:hypothetical protein
VAERSEAGWGGAQRGGDGRQHTLEIAIDVMVPETQRPEPLAGKMIVARQISLGMRVEVMLTAVDLDDQVVFETDEIHDVAITRRLAAEVESVLSPCAQMNPQLHLLRGHSFAQAASDFVRHDPPPGRLRRPPSPYGGGISRYDRAATRGVCLTSSSDRTGAAVGA